MSSSCLGHAPAADVESTRNAGSPFKRAPVCQLRLAPYTTAAIHCRSDLSLAEACRGDVESFCKDKPEGEVRLIGLVLRCNFQMSGWMWRGSARQGQVGGGGVHDLQILCYIWFVRMHESKD